MSVRARSWLGAIALLGAVLFLMTGVMVGGPLFDLVWPGAALGIIGVLIVVSAFRRVSRDIGSGQARLESMLRSEMEARRDRKKEPS